MILLVLACIFFSLVYGEPTSSKIQMYSLCTSNLDVYWNERSIQGLEDDYHFCLKTYLRSENEQNQINVSLYSCQKVDLILQAIEENWGSYFVYADPRCRFFVPIHEYISDRMKEFNFLALKRTAEGNISTGFFVCSANSSTKALWQAIRQGINTGTFKSDQEAIDVLLNYKHRHRNTFGIKWNYLSAAFICAERLFVDFEKGGKCPVPYEIVMYCPSGCTDLERDSIELDYIHKSLAGQKEAARELSLQGAVDTNQKFVLLTMLYNETDKQRINEYLTCLTQNKAHPLIEDIHILYDCSRDSESSDNVIKSYILNNSITMSVVDGRQSFNDFFKIAKKRFPKRKIIIANADICFNETLGFLAGYDLSNTFLVLSRWDWYSNNCRIFTDNYPADSQDAWIYQEPLPRFANERILLGTMSCDGRISLAAKNVGLNIINPSLTVQALHFHRSNVRHYDPTKYHKGEKHRVEPSVLF